jgi:cysteinyl-tRNA synthetase
MEERMEVSSKNEKGLRVTNDLTRAKEPFAPVNGDRVNMYVCGVTAYDHCHIGHARCYICFDVIRRYLEFKGYDVFHIQNFTDVDDKIINKANELGIGFGELAREHEASYFETMDALGVKRAAAYPRATEHIEPMIKMISGLMEKGHAYEAEGNVYFSVSTFDGYGRMAGTEGDAAAADGQTEPGKRERRDFALWKAAKEGEPWWESPWGKGRPGWHLECSAMAVGIAGPTLDIHGGGRDLMFPHHENEIAQSEAFTGKPFAKYWLHNGFVELDREKMSKSLGNVIHVKDILKKTRPDALRLLFLSAHYRSPVSYSDDRLAEAEKGLARFETFFSKVDAMAGRAAPGDGGERAEAVRAAADRARTDFIAAMDDDFDTPAAVAALFTLARIANTRMAEIDSAPDARATRAVADALESAKTVVLELGGILGLFQGGVLTARSDDGGLVDSLIGLLVRIRDGARAKKDWAVSDAVRDELENLGFIIEDGPAGTSWRRKQ